MTHPFRPSFLLRAMVPAMVIALVALATTPARAEFVGAGTIFGASNCSWPTGVEMTRARYRAAEVDGGRGSAITLNFAVGGVNTYNFYTNLTPSRVWRRAAGRSIWGSFANMRTRPLVRVLQRQNADSSSAAQMQSASNVYLRMRIRNFNGEPGCAVTVALTMNRLD